MNNYGFDNEAYAAFMEAATERANLIYFNYQFTGERVGRALIGFDFASVEEREGFREFAESDGGGARTVRPLTEDQLGRVLG